MESPKKDDAYIGAEILRQLGGNKFIAMTGARCFVSLPEKWNNKPIKGGLMFMLPPGGVDKINKVIIGLDYNDTYLVIFGHSYGLDFKYVSEWLGIYSANLIPLIEGRTGFRISL